MAVEAVDPQGRTQDIWLLELARGVTSRFTFDSGNDIYPVWSPDGRWLAYVSTESGRYEVFVQSFPAPGGGKWQISKDGGLHPRWRRDGRELFYYAPDGRLMAVPLTSATALDVGAAVSLFEPHLVYGPVATGGIRQQYDVARDGQRFLLNVPLEDTAASSITVVLNWTARLGK